MQVKVGGGFHYCGRKFRVALDRANGDARWWAGHRKTLMSAVELISKGERWILIALNIHRKNGTNIWI